MSIDLPYKLFGLLIVVGGWAGGCIWGLSKIHSNFKSLEEEFGEYKESQKETFVEYKKLIEKQISDIRKDTEEFGKKFHEHNKNTQTVINKMRQDEIIPATMNIEALFKSDKESKKDTAEIKKSIKEVSDLMHNMDTKIEVLIQSNG